MRAMPPPRALVRLLLTHAAILVLFCYLFAPLRLCLLFSLPTCSLGSQLPQGLRPFSGLP